MLAGLPPLESYKFKKTTNLKNTTVREVFNVIFMKFPYQGCENYFEYHFLHRANAKDYKVTSWNPPIPDFLSNMEKYKESTVNAFFEDFCNAPRIFERKRSFRMEQDTKIPLIGKVSAHVDMVDKVYLISPDNIRIEFVSSITGALYSDHFDLIQADNI